MIKLSLTIALLISSNILHAAAAAYYDLGKFETVAYSYKVMSSDACDRRTCFVHLRTIENGVSSDFGGMLFCHSKQLMIMLKSTDGDLVEGTGTIQKIQPKTPGHALFERLCL